MKQSFSFPAPISVNEAFKNVPGVGRVQSKRYKAWRQEAGWMVISAKPRGVQGDVAVHVEVAASTYRGDLDNVLKAVLDTLQETGVFANDRQVRLIRAEFTNRFDFGMIVHVEPLVVAA